MPPLVVDVVQNHRAALLARETAAMQEQARRWLQVEQAIQAQTDALALELARTPGSATMGQLSRSRRYAALMEQTRDELRKYEDYIEPRITDGQRDMITRAIQHSEQAVQAVATESGITVPFNRLPVQNVEAMVGLAGDGSPLRSILADASRVGPDALAQHLVNGIALGRNPIEVARQAIRQGLGQSFTRMQAIARSESLRVYRLTTLASYGASRVIGSYRRLSARDDRVCAGCLFADGREYQINEGFDAHPQCIVGGTVVSSPAILATSKRWYDGQVIEIRTVNGHILTVTPNHPILTDKGWIAAHLLQEGDNVISSRDGQRTVSAVDPNDYSRPTVIEDVLESFARTGGMIKQVTQSASMFHGDGTEGQGLFLGYSCVDYRWHGLFEYLRQGAPHALTGEQYDLVTFPQKSLTHHTSRKYRHHGYKFPASLLALRQRPRTAPVFGELPLGVCDDCADKIRVRFGGDSLRPVPIPSVPLAFLGGFAHDDLAYSVDLPQGAFAFPSRFSDAGAHSMFRKDPSLHTLSGDFGIHSIYPCVDYTTATGIMQIDAVASVNRHSYSGYVYNLETSTGWYIANGVVTHNCRCTLIPVLRNVPPVQYETGQEWFTRQPESTQLAILGRGRYDLWRRGAATLDDMISRDWSDTWGGSLRTTRVRDLG